MKMSKVQTISVISFLSFCFIVGCLVFARGFLLNRQTVPNKTTPCFNAPKSVAYHNSNREDGGKNFRQDTYGENPFKKDVLQANWCNSGPLFSKVILVLVDALRYDFVQRMPFLREMVAAGTATSKTQPKDVNSVCLFKFVADPPTTTMQRLKALMTGTMPTFIDASANFNSYEIEEDSLVYQLYVAGKKLAFFGDDTWLSLFPETYFKSPFVEAHPSFNAWDLDTVDRAVNRSLREILLPAHENEWDVLITHLLGVDHCGHRYGPNHPEMIRKLNESDKIIEHVFNSMTSDTLLVVFGDHGMTATGDHGGDSRDETEAAIVFLSKQTERQKQINPPFQCSKQLSISQIDLVPTLASLIGIPIPYSNIGQIIPDFLPNKFYSDGVAANVAQVQKYIQNFPQILLGPGGVVNGEDSLQEQYKKIEEAFSEFQSSRNSTTRFKLHTLCKNYLLQVKSIAVSTWTQFNIPMIYTGVLISFLSVVSLVLYLAVVPRILNRNTAEHNYTVLSWLWPSLSHWAVLWTFVYHPTASSGVLGIIVSTLSGVIIFLSILVFKTVQSISKSWGKSCPKWWKYPLFIFKQQDISEWSAVVVYLFTCLVVFSNSFVIYEGTLLGASLIWVVFCRVVNPKDIKRDIENIPDNDNNFVTNNTTESTIRVSVLRKRIKCTWSCFITLAAAIRISALFFRCREEQVKCTEEFLLHKQLSSLPEDWMVHKYLRYGIALLTLAVFVVSFRHWMLFRKCVFSKKPRAIVARFIPSMLVVLLGVFWALQGLPYISSNASKVRLLMNYLPLLYQLITISSLLCVWFKPLCCTGGIRNYWNIKKTPSSLSETYANTFTASEVASNVCVKANSKSDSSVRKKSPAVIGNGVKKLNGLLNGTTLSPRNSTFLGGNSNPVSTTYTKNKRLQKMNDNQDTLIFSDCSSPDTYSSSVLTFLVLLTLLCVQVTSTGIAPAVILEILAIICLVGIYRCSPKHVDSWSAAVSWTLLSQFFFYATGHQPLFSAIPWDSAFVGTSESSGLTTSGSWIIWARAGLSVVGNLHTSQILASFSLPLIVYWKMEVRSESRMGRSEARKVFSLCGRFIALHGLKLLMCMACAGWQRRHLMVWKIFAPKFIFEAISFIVTSSTVLLSMIFINRIYYFHQLVVSKSFLDSV